jgi:putative NADPH-quinone reductase
MAKKVLILQGHPDPAGGRLCHALANAYAEGAREAGHDVTEIAIAAIDFPLLRSQAEFEHGPIPPALAGAKEALLASDHLVIVFPLWLGTMPALLKGFLEQLMRPSVAFAYGEKGFTKKLLAGRSARIVVTMGMPALLYRFYFFAHGVRGLERNILGFTGFSPVRESLLGMVADASPAKVGKWLGEMRALGARAR